MAKAGSVVPALGHRVRFRLRARLRGRGRGRGRGRLRLRLRLRLKVRVRVRVTGSRGARRSCWSASQDDKSWSLHCLPFMFHVHTW